MHSSSFESHDQAALVGIARRVEAATCLLGWINDQQNESRCLVLDAATLQLRLYAEAIRLACLMACGRPEKPSADLVADAAVVMPGVSIGTSDPRDLLDEYVCCRLIGITAAIRVIEWVYVDRPGLPDREAGRAIFECLHWIERARAELLAMMGAGDDG